jgi:hypothetical protein
MATHRRRHSRKSSKKLGGLGALSTNTMLLIVGGVAVVGVGAYFLLKKDAPVYGGGGMYPPGGGYGPYTGTLPPGVTQSTADQLIAQYGPAAVDAIVKYGPQAFDYLKNAFSDGGGASVGTSSCTQLANFPAGTCDSYKRYGANESNGCWYGYDGAKSVIWGQNPNQLCANVNGLGYYRRGY